MGAAQRASESRRKEVWAGVLARSWPSARHQQKGGSTRWPSSTKMTHSWGYWSYATSDLCSLSLTHQRMLPLNPYDPKHKAAGASWRLDAPWTLPVTTGQDRWAWWYLSSTGAGGPPSSYKIRPTLNQNNSLLQAAFSGPHLLRTQGHLKVSHPRKSLTLPCNISMATFSLPTVGFAGKEAKSMTRATLPGPFLSTLQASQTTQHLVHSNISSRFTPRTSLS